MKRLIPFVMVTLIVASCTSSDSTYTVETIDGVRYVHNHAPAWGEEPKVALELIRKFGEVGSEDESGYLFNPVDMVRDSRGNVYVLELTDAHIEKFAPDGTHLATIGTKGQGPGEMMMPSKMEIDRNDNIVVYDTGNQRFQVFSPEGEDLGSWRRERRLGLLRFLTTGDFVVETVQTDPNGPSHTFEKYDAERNLKLTFGQRFDFDDMEEKYLYQESCFSVTPDDNIVSAFISANCVEKYSPDGALLFRADRPLKFDPQFKVVTVTLPLPDAQPITMSLPGRSQVSQFIDIDHKGRIWIITYKLDMVESLENFTGELPEGRFELHILNSDGVFLGVIELPFDPRMFRIFGDRLYLIEAVNEMVVYEYRIVEL
ncbi:6-bladed beta-propeller [candidate division KSB1 bacterium]